MAVATMRRAADLDAPWWTRAACKDTAHLHQAERQPHEGHNDGRVRRRVGALHGMARHICLSHCGVRAQCERDIADRKPHGLVQAGVLYEAAPGAQGRAAREQPRDPGCGPHCQELRGIEVPPWKR